MDRKKVRRAMLLGGTVLAVLGAAALVTLSLPEHDAGAAGDPRQEAPLVKLATAARSTDSERRFTGGRHSWPLTTPRPLMAYSRVRAEADIDRFWHALHILRLTPSGYAALNDGGYILAVRIGKLWVLPIAG
jgi:hypothetical protein